MKHSSTRNSIATHKNITLRKPSLSSGLSCPVHGTPPTFIPKTDMNTHEIMITAKCFPTKTSLDRIEMKFTAGDDGQRKEYY